MKKNTLLIISYILLSMIILTKVGMHIIGTGFVYAAFQESGSKEAQTNKDTYKILCLGESTTAGGYQLFGYPHYLKQELNSRNIGRKFSMINKGIAGTDTNFILTKLKENLENCKPDMVVTMLGINDTRADIVYEHEKSSKTKRTADIVINNITKPNNDKAVSLTAQGDNYKNMKKYEEALKMFRKAIEINPTSCLGYRAVGILYNDEHKYEEAEETFKKALQIDPKDAENYNALGRCYWDMKNFEEALKMYEKAVELDPKSAQNYLLLGKCYRHMRRYEDAVKIYSKAIAIDPNDQSLYANLAEAYSISMKYDNLEEILVKAVELDFKDDRAYRLLYELSKKYCKKEVSDKYLDKINEFESNSYYLTTKTNYNKLVNIVKKKGIKLVCVQYPVRSVRLLEKLLDTKDGIIFVDNEKIFKDAVNKEGYEKYFDDRFAGDFGHSTDEGDRLLARNIADTIAKEIFNK